MNLSTDCADMNFSKLQFQASISSLEDVGFVEIQHDVANYA
jgi:hypothetical protein